eukprot:7937764-Alexandrium_andersonii.AAC.1
MHHTWDEAWRSLTDSLPVGSVAGLMEAAGILLQTGVALSRGAAVDGQDWTTHAKRALLTRAISTIRT